MPPDLTILLLTDSEQLRALFREALTGEELELLAASTGGEIPVGVSLVLVDLQHTGRGGLEQLRALSVARPRLPIICIGDDPQLLVEAHRAGADGFLTGLTSADEVRLAIALLMS